MCRMWLDDWRDPSDIAMQNRYGCDGTEIWVKSVEEAKALLLTGTVNFISLDHDLGKALPTGYDLVKWIEERVFMGQWKGLFPEYAVHSDNPVGKKNMLYGLKAARKAWEKLNPETLFRGKNV